MHKDIRRYDTAYSPINEGYIHESRSNTDNRPEGEQVSEGLCLIRLGRQCGKRQVLQAIRHSWRYSRRLHLCKGERKRVRIASQACEELSELGVRGIERECLASNPRPRRQKSKNVRVQSRSGGFANKCRRIV